MKKTFQANINGKIYQIDEDAYQLLQNYFSQLRDAFPGEEGEEIVGDIEFRMSEHFDQRLSQGVTVIVINDVNRVIGIMGRPEEISGEVDFDIAENSTDSRKDTASSRPRPYGSEPKDGDYDSCKDTSGMSVPPAYHKKLFRDERHKVFGGVVAGLAQYLGWDTTILRILIVVVAFTTIMKFSLFWPIVLAYLICWMVIPGAITPRQILEMKGEPVTVGSVGQTVIETSEPPVAPVPEGGDVTNTINSIFQAIGRVILVFLGGIGAITGFLTGLMGVLITVALGVGYYESNDTLLDFVGSTFGAQYLSGWGVAFACYAVSLPCLVLFYAGLTALFKAPSINRSTAIVLLVIEILLIIGSYAFIH